MKIFKYIHILNKFALNINLLKVKRFTKAFINEMKIAQYNFVNANMNNQILVRATSAFIDSGNIQIFKSQMKEKVAMDSNSAIVIN